MAQKNITFEQSLERLETIVSEMEEGHLPLETMIRHFEEGSRLVTRCNNELNDAEQRIEKLVKTEEGTLREEPFQEEEQTSS